MKPLSLPRAARLKSQKAIDSLFLREGARNGTPPAFRALCYPVRALAAPSQQRPDGYRGPRIMVAVPKKKVRRAVDRVKLRRRMREAWRLNPSRLTLGDIDVAFIYVADKVESYGRINEAIGKIIAKLQPV